jgi:hypothetical protein
LVILCMLAVLTILFIRLPGPAHGQEPEPSGTPGTLSPVDETPTDTPVVTETLPPEPTATATPPPPVLFPLVFRQHQQEPVNTCLQAVSIVILVGIR